MNPLSPPSFSRRRVHRWRRIYHLGSSPDTIRAISTPSSAPISLLGRLAAVWAMGGVLALVGHGVAVVAPVALEAWAEPLTTPQWGFAIVWIVFMAYSEGYCGFQQRFAPRVVARAMALARDPRPLRVALAPAFAIGFVWATRRRLVVSWAITGAIVGVVVVVRLLPQPWRGIVDAGVVVGLAWGGAALLFFAVQGLMGRPPDIDPQLPDGEPASS